MDVKNESNRKFRVEIENMVRKCIFEINIDENKFRCHPRNTDETSLDFRYGIYSICQILIDAQTNSVKEIIIIDDTQKYKCGNSKLFKARIENVVDIENYKDLILAHLKCYID